MDRGSAGCGRLGSKAGGPGRIRVQHWTAPSAATQYPERRAAAALFSTRNSGAALGAPDQSSEIPRLLSVLCLETPGCWDGRELSV